MRSSRVIAVLVPLLILVGCSKRTTKKPAADSEPTAAAKTQPQSPDKPKSGGAKGAKAEEGNWLKDDRFKTDSGDGLPLETPVNGGKPGWGTGSGPKGGWTAPPPGEAPQAGAGGAVAGGPLAVPPPALGIAPTTPTRYSTVTEADMKEIWVFVENRSGASGKMPSQLDIYRALLAASYNSGALVKDGSITLTGATARESIWAYETKALLSGGLACSQNGVETLTAAELRKRLGK